VRLRDGQLRQPVRPGRGAQPGPAVARWTLGDDRAAFGLLHRPHGAADAPLRRGRHHLGVHLRHPPLQAVPRRGPAPRHLPDGPAAAPRTFCTRYHRWHEAFRPVLFDQLRYTDVSALSYANSFPKAGDEVERAIWKKLHAHAPLGQDLAGPATVYYHNAPRYWVRALTFAPYFWNERDGARLSTQVKPLTVRDTLDGAAVAAALNSSLFYWWWVLLSDCRHLNAREVERFPLGLRGMGAATKAALADLCTCLIADYRRHAVRKECRYRATGRVAYDEFFPRHSKPILDDIDRVLARHLGLNEEEFDFVVNYDFKYRMGAAGRE
jgi:hypothetical protein